ncbi:hypothetical protein [Azospirillum argentinense]|uniref:CHAT domain-containing protein n=1 Tax=Azospirillum TaxID=191 RepID=UPI000E0A639C|nr:CHAT domain-containing protein [Azospirillum brasilense]
MKRATIRIVATAVLLAALGGCMNTSSPRPGETSFLVGRNGIGEACRAQPGARPEGGAGVRRTLDVYCGNWQEPSARVTELSADMSASAVLENYATQSWWRGDIDQRLNCPAPAAAKILDRYDALLMECRRKQGGWPVVAVVASVNGTVFLAEGIPVAMSQIENTVGGLAGAIDRSKIEEAGGSRSSVAERLEAQTKFSIGDLSAFENAMRLGQYYNSIREFAKAEDQYRQALAVLMKFQPDDEINQGVLYAHLALQASNQQRFAIADGLFEQAEAKLGGAEDLVRLRLGSYRALHLANQRQYDGALEQAKKIAGERQSVSVAKGADRRGRNDDNQTFSVSEIARNTEILFADMALDTYTQARMQEKTGRLKEASATLDQAFGVLGQARLAPAWWRPQFLFLQAGLDVDSGNPERGVSRLETVIAEQRKLFSNSRLEVLALLALGKAHAATERTEDALRAFRAAFAISAERSTALSYDVVYPFFDLMLTLAENDPGKADAYFTEMFEAGQLVRGTMTSQAIARTALRMSADRSAGGVIRRLQDAERDHDRAKNELARMEADPQALSNELDFLRTEVETKKRAVSQLTQEVQSAFPRYQSLLDAPVKVADVQAQLTQRDALYQIIVGEPMSVAFLIRKNGMTAYRVALTPGQAARETKALRSAIDGSQLLEYDVIGANKLFETLMGPAKARMADVDHLVTVPSGPLLSLPLGLLVTEPHPRVADNRDYRTVPWLIQRYALTLTPSVRSFVDLRRVEPSTAPQPFIGFGDPLPFTNVDAVLRNRNLPESCRSEVARLTKLPRLEGTDREVRSVAQSLQASTGSVLIRDAFSHEKVRQLGQAPDNGTALLEQYRIVYFATHGLLPNELNCWSEPALMVSLPEGAPQQYDGLLAASEIEQLRLNADLVVLSACNTGAEGSGGGESLTGIARSFFVGGARSLLVSHWQVDNGATIKLMTELFRRIGGERSQGSAYHLQSAQKEIIADLEQSHPYFWAAFTLVGDGNRPITLPARM